MASTLTQYLKLRVDDSLTSNARYNLARIDTLGARFTFASNEDTLVRSIHDIVIQPEDAAVGGTPGTGYVTIGDEGNEVLGFTVWGPTRLNGDLELLDQGSGGEAYLHLQYDSSLTGPGTDPVDRTITLDPSGADRSVILGGDISTTASLFLLGGENLSITTEGDTRLVTLAGDLTVAGGTITLDPNGGSRQLDMSANATIEAGLIVSTVTTLTGGDSLTVQTTGDRVLNAVVDGDIVTATATQTLTGKTIDADANTITDIRNANIAANAAVALTKMATMTPSEVVVSDSDGYMNASGISYTKLTYLSDVTSPIQAQLDSKASSELDNLNVSGLAAGSLLIGSSATAVQNLPLGPNGSVARSTGTTIEWAFPVGAGDVVGPATATDNALARFDGTNGKVIQSSTVSLNDAGTLSWSAGGQVVGLTAPAAPTETYTFTLPVDSGEANYFLRTNGSGVTSWAEVPPPSLQESWSGGNTIDVSTGDAVEIFKTTDGGRALHVHHDGNASGPGGAALLVERFGSGSAMAVYAGDSDALTLSQTPTAANADTAVYLTRDPGFSSTNPVVLISGPAGDTQLRLSDGTVSGDLRADTNLLALALSTPDGAGDSHGITVKSGMGGGGNSGGITLISGDAMIGGQSGDVTVGTGFQFGGGATGALGLSTGMNLGTGGSGAISLLTGSTTLGGNSGGISLMTGNPGESTSASGNVSIATGDAFTGGDTGSINIVTGFTATETVGSINFITGNSLPGANGGNIAFLAMMRDSAGVGTAGSISFLAGDSIQNGHGGTVTIQSGGATNAGNAGGVAINAGSASMSGDGGSITLQAGMSDSGDGGHVDLNPGASTSGTNGQIRFGGDAQFGGGDSTYIGLRFLKNAAPFDTSVRLIAPTSIPTTYDLTLPTGPGSSGQLLRTDGSGVLSWITAMSPTSLIAVSSNVTLTDKAVHLVDTTAARSLALPAPSVGLCIVVKDAAGTGAATNNITITRPGAQTIDGTAASYTMNSTRQSITIVSDGANYFII